MKPIRRVSFKELDNFIDAIFPNHIFQKLPSEIKEAWWECIQADSFSDLKRDPEATQVTYEKVLKLLAKYKNEIEELKVKYRY